MLSFFTGRSDRQEYWISVALLVVAGVVLELLNMQAATIAVTVMWIITWMRRLHDIGRPGWMSLLPVIIGFAIISAGLALAGPSLVNAIADMEKGNPPPNLSDRTAYIFIAVVIAALIVQFGFTIWLGVKKGDAGNNRFGAPPEKIFPKRD